MLKQCINQQSQYGIYMANALQEIFSKYPEVTITNQNSIEQQLPIALSILKEIIKDLDIKDTEVYLNPFLHSGHVESDSLSRAIFTSIVYQKELPNSKNVLTIIPMLCYGVQHAVAAFIDNEKKEIILLDPKAIARASSFNIPGYKVTDGINKLQQTDNQYCVVYSVINLLNYSKNNKDFNTVLPGDIKKINAVITEKYLPIVRKDANFANRLEVYFNILRLAFIEAVNHDAVKDNYFLDTPVNVDYILPSLRDMYSLDYIDIKNINANPVELDLIGANNFIKKKSLKLDGLNNLSKEILITYIEFHNIKLILKALTSEAGLEHFELPEFIKNKFGWQNKNKAEILSEIHTDILGKFMCYIKNLFIKNNIESNSQFILKFLDVVVSAPKPILPIVKEDFENYNLNDIIKSYIDELVINVATNIGTDCCSSVVSVVYSPENISQVASNSNRVANDEPQEARSFMQKLYELLYMIFVSIPVSILSLFFNFEHKVENKNKPM
tara:strand:- start:14685 stop:16181 length:1497 start_codon:yes stop_codon:yes gene_type:complete